MEEHQTVNISQSIPRPKNVSILNKLKPLNKITREEKNKTRRHKKKENPMSKNNAVHRHHIHMIIEAEKQP